MSRSLEEYYIMGIQTSIDFLKRIMEVKDFKKGLYDTHFIEEHSKELFDLCDPDQEIEDLALIVAFMEYIENAKLKENGFIKQPVSNWKVRNRKLNISRREV